MVSMHDIFLQYGIDSKVVSIVPYGNGLINHTWKVTTPAATYILQQVNQSVFEKPQDIAHNIEIIASYLRKADPNYLFITPLPTLTGETLLQVEGAGFFRLFPFVAGSVTKDVVETPAEAYEAARQFSLFTKKLSGIDPSLLRETIPDFHNLQLRYQQFEKSLEEGDKKRIQAADKAIKKLIGFEPLVQQYRQVKNNPAFRLRVTHHDTKISNVLFDAAGRGICVIDLDTVMPGYFISDVGDMMRTYLSPASEEETDLSKVVVREDYFKAIVEGYLSEMSTELTAEEKGTFFFAGHFLVYMQALRFLTDYLLGDVYYATSYPEQNFNRAKNQLHLLNELVKKEMHLRKEIRLL